MTATEDRCCKSTSVEAHASIPPGPVSIQVAQPPIAKTVQLKVAKERLTLASPGTGEVVLITPDLGMHGTITKLQLAWEQTTAQSSGSGSRSIQLSMQPRSHTIHTAC